MKSKLKAVGKLQQMEEKQRDRVGQQLDAMRQRHSHLSMQLEQLSALKGHAGQSTRTVPTLTSAALMNFNRVDQMLQKCFATMSMNKPSCKRNARLYKKRWSTNTLVFKG